MEDNKNKMEETMEEIREKRDLNVRLCNADDYGYGEGTCVVAVDGRLNSRNITEFAKMLQELVPETTVSMIFDFKDLEFSSSAGLRVLLKIKKRIDDFHIINCNDEVYDVLDMTGLTEILDVRRPLRKISVAGCQVIAQGGRGKVYRLTEDTICKVSLGFSSVRAIHDEIVRSRAALIAGIPCALSYDMVECEEGLGLIYEMLSADTLGKCFRDESRFEELIRLYAETVKNVTETRIESRKLPKTKEIYYHILDASAEKLGEEKVKKFQSMLDGIPELGTFNHNDFHGNNVMVVGDEILLIDMADASIGHPVYDIFAIATGYYFCARPYGLPDEVYESRYSVTKKTGAKIWEAFCSLYFEGLPEQVKADRRHTAEVLSVLFSIKYLDEVVRGGNLTEEEIEKNQAQIARFTDMVLSEYDFIMKTVGEWN